MPLNVAKVFVNSQGNKIKLTANVVAILREHVQDLPMKKEVGGVLLGRFILDCGDVVVDKITTPLPGDSHSRFGIIRSARPHQEIISTVWSSTNGTCNYLGEWHTHPELFPSPSTIDIITWRKKLLFDQVDSDVLFFTIVGIQQISVWQGCKKSIAIDKLEEVP